MTEHRDKSGETAIIAVITVSDRSARGERADVSGPRATEILRDAGYETTASLVPDGENNVATAISAAIADGAHAVITSGGTGIGPRDLTPEGTRPLITTELPGIAEELRRHGASNNRMSVLSRGLAGIATSESVAAIVGGAQGAPVAPGKPNPPGVLVVNLPGSVKAVEEGLEVLLPLLPHILEQLRGGDHESV